MPAPRIQLIRNVSTRSSRWCAVSSAAAPHSAASSAGRLLDAAAAAADADPPHAQRHFERRAGLRAVLLPGIGVGEQAVVHVYGFDPVEARGARAAKPAGRVEQRRRVAATAEGDQQRPRGGTAFLHARTRFVAAQPGNGLAQRVEQLLLDRIRLRGSFP
jgi:hypothetical protein